MNSRSPLCLVLLILVSFLTSGCEDGANQPTAIVIGHVYYKNRPLTSGIIVFSPDAERGCKGELATADIQPDGSYSLKTNNRQGAPIGWHRITILSLDDRSPGAVKSLIPSKYRDVETTDLVFEVKPDIGNVKDIYIED
jgi:hypothetical protein